MTINQAAEMTTISEMTNEHLFDCFEIVAEELVEAGIAETGEADEILEACGFRTVADEWMRIVTETPERCRCEEYR